jgi:hypothetical protein
VIDLRPAQRQPQITVTLMPSHHVNGLGAEYLRRQSPGLLHLLELLRDELNQLLKLLELVRLQVLQLLQLLQLLRDHLKHLHDLLQRLPVELRRRERIAAERLCAVWRNAPGIL